MINDAMSRIRQKTAPVTALKISTARTGTPKIPVGKVNNSELLKTRAAIGAIFAGTKFHDVWKRSAAYNSLMNQDIPTNKVNQNFDAEFSRLHKAVIDTFKEGGNEKAAREFALTVPVYTQAVHPVDFIATLVKGASSPIAKKGQADQYAVLHPFKKLMQMILTNKGIAAPNAMPELTQLFYNTVVAKKGGNYEPANFDDMTPAEQYHVDDSVVKAVTVFIKDLADRKESGEQLPKVLDTIASEGIKVKQTLKDTATEEVNKEVGASIMGNSKYIIAAVVIVLAFFLLRK